MVSIPDAEALSRLLRPDLETRTGALSYLKLLNETGYRITWRALGGKEEEGIVISTPDKTRWPRIGRSVARRVAERLEIRSKEDWEAERYAAGL